MSIKVDSKLISSIDRTMESRSENKFKLCFECGGKLDECSKNNVIEDSKKTTLYGYLCCSCNSENEALDADLASEN